MNHLFSTFDLRQVRFPNRIIVSSMQQFAAINGHTTDWHSVHLGSRAVGGAGCVFLEMTAVSPEGRSTLADTGIWNDTHIESLKPVVKMLASYKSVPAIQLGHAGRKASMHIPFQKRGALEESDGGWSVFSSSAISAGDGYRQPKQLTSEEIKIIIESYGQTARRADKAGFELLEIHGGHGYLIHQFLSPLSNMRTDCYGGCKDNRSRLLREVIQSIRRYWPSHKPLSLRLSMKDNVKNGWQFDDTLWIIEKAINLGVDIIDCSNIGGLGSTPKDESICHTPDSANTVRQIIGVPVIAVGGITDALEAEEIIKTSKADFVAIAREMLRDPYWSARAAKTLGYENPINPRYSRAW